MIKLDIFSFNSKKQRILPLKISAMITTYHLTQISLSFLKLHVVAEVLQTSAKMIQMLKYLPLYLITVKQNHRLTKEKKNMLQI